MLDYQLLIDYAPLFLHGLVNTIILGLLAVPIALILGTIIAYCRLSSNFFINRFARIYLETLRNVPFLIQLFLIYYLLPFYGIRFPAFFVGVIALSMYASSYFSEIIRSGIISIPAGQYDAAQAFGLSRFNTMRYIVFPQLPKFVTPPIINQSSTLIKDTSLLSAITVQELTMSAQMVQLETYNYVEPLLLIAVLYVSINIMLTLIFNTVEAHYSRKYNL